MNKVISATKIPKNPSNKIGELGNHILVHPLVLEIEFDLNK